MSADGTPPREPADCADLEQVRREIDAIDRRIVVLLARREGYVVRAAGFKRSAEEVRAPDRAARVIANAVALARAEGADPAVVERIYREMVAAFTDREMGARKG